MKRFDVVALGELLIDFTENGMSEQGNSMLEANPGGAPCNVLSMLQKLGNKTAFIGKVGDDNFGHMLKNVVSMQGIDVSGLIFDKEVHTTLAFVHTAQDGDRSFSFYRNPGADVMLTEAEVPKELIEEARVFHFGTLSMTHREVRNATKKAVRIAKENELIISFDPNLRKPLWENLDDARNTMSYGFANCDILKISDDELLFFTGEESIVDGVKKIQNEYDIKLICATMGKDGSMAFYKDMTIFEKPYLNKQTIETTGAGDTFMGIMLSNVLAYGLDKLTEENLHAMLSMANAGASLITQRRGALKVMPTKEEIIKHMRSKEALDNTETQSMDYIKFIRSKVGHDKIILNAAGGIIVKDNKILLQRRTDNDKWGCFGGMMEIGETYQSCAIREIKEETGLDVNLDYLIGVYPNYHMEYPNGDKAQVMCAVYKMSIIEKDGEEAVPYSSDGESKEIKWFAYDEIPEIFAEDHRRGIADFLAGKRNQIY